MPVLRKMRTRGAGRGGRSGGGGGRRGGPGGPGGRGMREVVKNGGGESTTMWWIVILAIISVLLFLYLIKTPNTQTKEGFSGDEAIQDIINSLETDGLSKKPDMRNISNTVNDYVLSKMNLDKSDHDFVKKIMTKNSSKMFNPTAGNIKYHIDQKGSFTDFDISKVDKIIQDSRGWRSAGWTFSPVEAKQGEGVDVIIYCKKREEMGQLFPQAHLLGLSVTDMGSRPKKIYLDETNWNNVPKGFEGSLQEYRQYVVQHEMGHVLDYPHQLPDGTKGEVDNEGKHNGEPVKGVHSPCPVMYQQTKGTKGRCRMNPWVSMEKK